MIFLAVALVAGGGTGMAIYFLVGGTATKPIPEAKQSPPLEKAKAEGIISGYGVVPGLWGTYCYEVAGGEISLTFPDACGNRSCPPGSTPIIQIEYRHDSEAQARKVLALTQAWAKRTFKPPLVNGPPDYRWHREGNGFILKVFETTA